MLGGQRLAYSLQLFHLHFYLRNVLAYVLDFGFKVIQGVQEATERRNRTLEGACTWLPV